MVLNIKKITLLLAVLLLHTNCNKQYEPFFIDEKVVQEFPEPDVRGIPLDQEILATLITQLLIHKDEVAVSEPLVSAAIHTVPIHPLDGPFFFHNKNLWLIVAKDNVNLETWIETTASNIGVRDVYFVTLLDSEKPNEIRVSQSLEKIQGPQFLLGNDPQKFKKQNGRFRLSPEIVASALSKFPQWEGAHLDDKNQELILVGSNKVQNPQISSSDLIAAYNAIFVHEAAGDPLFVDMDFAGSEEEYLVTFGGGFEDTRPGRVLLAGDLLLKALSSGIDPWVNAKPLVQQMCAVRNKTPFQQLFCEYINPAAFSNQRFKNQIDLAEEKFEQGKSEAQTIIYFAREADEHSSNPKQAGPWEYLFSINDRSKKQQILYEIEKNNGYFEYGNSCACVPIFKEVRDCKKDCNESATLKAVEEIFKPTREQKTIVNEARDFTNIDDRELYATLSFSSDQIRSFIRSQTIENKKEIFNTLRKLMRYSFENQNEFNTGIAILSFMAQNADFSQKFFNLSEDDQFILAFILTRMILDKDFPKFVNSLQYHNPLCCKSCDVPSEVKNLDDAFIRFVCKHLKQFPRTYLADLIRKDLPSYKTAAELRTLGLAQSLPPGIHTTRYWFFPENEVLYLSHDLNTFLFNRPNMEAKAERINSRRGPYETVNFLEDKKIPGVHENLKLVNENYETLAEIFPTLKELNNLVKMLAFFRWIRDFHADEFDLEAFANAVDHGTPTERNYPIYETVIALKGGGLLKSIGGVDLHSQTQVRFNQEKVDQFLKAYLQKDPNNHFPFEQAQYSTATPIPLSPFTKPTAVFTISSNTGQKFTMNTNGALGRVSFLENDRLKSTTATQVDIFERNLSVRTKYNATTDEICRETWSSKGELLEQWKISSTDHTLSILRVDSSYQGSRDYHRQIKLRLLDLLNKQMPLAAIWEAMSVDFENARLIHKNQKHLFSYWLDGKEKHLQAVQSSEKTKLLVEFITADQLDAFLAKSSECNGLGIQLQSSLPTDSLIVNHLGIKTDSLIHVNLFQEHDLSLDLFEWRSILTHSKKLPLKLNKVNIVSPVIQEFKKGKYQSFELTNRPFLVDAISGLRHKYGTSKRFVLGVNTDITKEKATALWQKPNDRMFLVDPVGFADHYLEKLTILAKLYPDNFKIIGYSSVSTKDEDAELELIWITALNENQIQERLEKELNQVWLANAVRLRILNIHNSVYSLGENIFVDQSQLKLIGAYPRILDFETVFPLLQTLLKQKELKELDEQIASVCKRLQREYRRTPTPSKLRIARYLEDLNITWEELAPDHIQWKIYTIK